MAQRRPPRTGALLLGVLLLFALLLVGVVVWGYIQAQGVPPVPSITPAPAQTATAATRPGQTPTPVGKIATTPAPASTPVAGAPYTVYFTQPVYPDAPTSRQGGLDERLTEFLRTARTSIDVAIYDLDLANVGEAMLDAHRRGARVRLVVDTDNLEHESVRALRDAGVPVVEDRRGAIMHHKFAVVDNEAVWTGSSNFTLFDTYRYNNNGVLWRDRRLAANYTATFEKMFAGQFGPTKPKGIPYPTITIGDIRVESHFASETDPTPAIVERVKGAQRSITFMAFSFTHDDIGQAMLARGRQGVRVRGVFERTGSETQFSEFGPFRDAGFDVLQDGNPYLMHHKVIVIDERTVIFGSFNFSANAANSNDENLLIVDDADLARLFLEEFERVYATAANPPARS